MNKKKRLNQIRERRKSRTRIRILGTALKPRLSVFRSNRQSYAQLIDDEESKTLISASTKDVKKSDVSGGSLKVNLARALGKLIAEEAEKAGIKTAIFDRGDKRYHGRVKAVAEGAREAGLKI